MTLLCCTICLCSRQPETNLRTRLADIVFQSSDGEPKLDFRKFLTAFGTVETPIPPQVASKFKLPMEKAPESVKSPAAFDHPVVSQSSPTAAGASGLTSGMFPQFMPFRRDEAAPDMMLPDAQTVAQFTALTGVHGLPEDYVFHDMSGQYAFRHVDGPNKRFQGQDSQGRVAFGHWGGPSNRYEVKDDQGRTVGIFNYINPNGEVETRMYMADAESGFRVAGTDLFDIPSA